MCAPGPSGTTTTSAPSGNLTLWLRAPTHAAAGVIAAAGVAAGVVAGASHGPARPKSEVRRAVENVGVVGEAHEFNRVSSLYLRTVERPRFLRNVVDSIQGQ